MRTNTTTVQVRWGDADPMGIVFYPNFFDWFDRATHELFRGPELSMARMIAADGCSMPIVECGARFHAPAFYDDELQVTSTVTDLGSRSFRLEHVVARDGHPIATGFEVRVVARYDPEAGRLETIDMPEHVRAWLAGA